MAWWGNDLDRESFSPKQKFRFMVEMGNGGKLTSVVSVTKPAASIEPKSYRMINHTYNYPGNVVWDPIEIRFVDFKFWGSSGVVDRGLSQVDIPNDRMTSTALWEMLVSSGYTPPANFSTKKITSERSKQISTPEKASTMDLSFGEYLRIHQLTPDGTIPNNTDNSNDGISSNETWELYNPIITKISWGDLSYGDDSLVEYSISVSYDYAIHYENYKID